jgi:hypothetical protein
MPKAMDFKKLDQLKESERRELERGRWKSRDINPTVQMSIRVEEEEYLRFRALCKAERRTNGDMLIHLMNAYLSTTEERKEKPR